MVFPVVGLLAFALAAFAQQEPANMSPEWAAAYTKAKNAVSRLSLNDKVNLGTGVGWMNGHCVGNTPPVSSISFPGLCLQDSPLGVRKADLVSAFPAGINTAATFNRDLMRKRGAALGEEFKGKGVHVALGPAMNIARAPAAGRNWEGFGGDPYLQGEAAFETITGIQSSGVQACAKHYINNEQEHSRESSSSELDDRTQHEIYALPFLRSVQANVASVMCSYNKINGTYACENDKVLNDLLKVEFGFPGYIMSDWGGTHSTSPSVNAGLDMTMPGDKTFGSGTTWFGDSLVQAVNSGQVSQNRINDLATRILAAWYLLKQDSGFPAVNFDSWNINNPVNQHKNVQGNHKELIRQIAAASTVLLKNVDQTLPLQKPATIGIIGNGAGPNSNGINSCEDRACTNGVLAQGWGSGTAEYPYLIDPLSAISARARSDGSTVSSTLSDSDLGAARSTASGKDVALVFITANSGEGYLTVEGNAGDRKDLKAWHNGDALVQAVASANPNTIVVVNSVGAIDMEAWVENPNVKAVVWSGLPGQEAGNGLVDILYGDYNPSGRLPYTIGKSINDYSARVLYDDRGPKIPYSEGIFVDYRHFDKENIEPRFEFGFGLSYTDFHYEDISISGSTGGWTSTSGPGSSLDESLHEKVVIVTFTLENNGTVAGTEIPQLYITLPEAAQSAPRNLKGFDSVTLEAGESKTVTIELSRFDFSIWDTASQRWEIPSGEATIAIGASSRDIRLSGTFDL
ncbi:glycoside hydrolase family 3 protein [Moniliophthora roreri MCA 2997]|uniref:beta-glucosidase n=1 Tax=Moniliophthora roreri (strain MCA 2997) TaxID=1381753 RepID=V2XXD2_MONRO|nr:glycoside hydrolase family 3 protein [Moniliophthora roreri MCA 2997]